MDEDSFAGLTPAQASRPAAFRDCAESVYTLQDLTKVALLVKGENGLDLATEYWYGQGDKSIDYATGRPKRGGNPRAVEALLHIIWKTTKKVGFGIKERWVVAWYCDVRPLSTLGEVAVASVESSPLLAVSSSRRLLASSSRRALAATQTNSRSNAMDGDAKTAMVTAEGVGMFYRVTLAKAGTKVQSVKLTNALTNPTRFTSYRVLVDQTTCGTTLATVAAGQEVVVTCGTAPDYIKGGTVTIETTTKTSLQLAEVRVVGTDDSGKALDAALKANAGASCSKRGFNSCFNESALARHNDYREGHENKSGNAYTLTPLLVINESNALALQSRMDQAGFAGKASLGTPPAGC